MDAVDLRLVRSMGIRPFEIWPRDPERFKPGYLAERAGVSPETVKARLQRMQEEGVIAGYEVYPNVRLFGLNQTSFHLRMSDDHKARAKEDLEPIEGLVGIYDFLGEDICVDLCYRDPADLDRKLKLVARLTDPQGEIIRWYDRAMPEPKRALTSLDWRIIRSMRRNGRKALEDVAAEIGVSTRTVRRRYDQMQQEGAIDTVVVVNLGRIPDLKVFNLIFHVDDPADKRVMAAIRKEFDASFLYAWQPPSQRFGSFHTTQFAHNNQEMEALRRRGGQIPGVQRCEVILPTSAYYHDAWLDEAIQARIEADVTVPG